MQTFMKKLFIKTLPLLAAIVLSGKIQAQQYFPDRVIDEASEISSYTPTSSPAYNAPGEEEEENNSNYLKNSSQDQEESEPTIIQRNDESAIIKSQTAAQRSSSTLDAPPDCPECIPDPAGDVPDVPFDRRLLVILIPAVISIVMKAYKNQGAKKAVESDAASLDNLQAA